MFTPQRKVCANCHNSYIEGDKYCRFCGAPMGTPEFIEEDFACIYGPMPEERLHKCEKCGFSWKTCQMIDDERFCPLCGGPAPVVSSTLLRLGREQVQSLLEELLDGDESDQ